MNPTRTEPEDEALDDEAFDDEALDDEALDDANLDPDATREAEIEEFDAANVTDEDEEEDEDPH